MSFWRFLQQNWPEVLQLIREHLTLVFVSTLIAVIIGIPAGVLLTRKQSLRGPILGIANVMQTVPSLALFGFLIPLPFIGGIGARTAVVTLVLYSLLPIIRNTVTGILGVDPNVREAAVAMGMTDRQILSQVEMPLAASVILTGVRVATVIAIGVTTIAAAVGAGGLGVYIFRGLRQYDNNLLLAGAVPAALMALAADFSLGVIGQYFSTGVRRAQRISLFQKLAVGTIVLLLIVIVAMSWRTVPVSSSSEARKVSVGSKDFTESILLAEIAAQLLEHNGISVERNFELGGNLPHEALVSGKIDLYPEYTGTSYTAIFHHAPISDPRAVYAQLKKDYAEKFNLDLGPPLGFENTFAILVRGADARRLNLNTISDAVPHAKLWTAGFGPDFLVRADGYPGLARAYGLRFSSVREMDLSLTYIALASSKVDLVAGNSTEGRIGALDLFQLADDRHYFPPYEAVFLIRKDILVRESVVQQVMTKLGNAISTEDMRKMNFEVDANKRIPREVANDWIQGKGLR